MRRLLLILVVSPYGCFDIEYENGNFVSCDAHDWCPDDWRCSGLIREELGDETCDGDKTVAGYEGRVTAGWFAIDGDEDKEIRFYCITSEHQNSRYFPHCTPPDEPACDTNPCTEGDKCAVTSVDAIPICREALQTLMDCATPCPDGRDCQIADILLFSFADDVGHDVPGANGGIENGLGVCLP